MDPPHVCVVTRCVVELQIYDDQDDGAVADNEAEVRTRGDCSYIYPTSLPYQYPAHAFNLHLPSQTAAPLPAAGVAVPVTGAMEVCSAGVKVEGGGAVTPLTIPAAAELPELPLCNTRYVLQSLRNRTHINTTAAQNSGAQASVGLTPAQLSYSAGMTLQQRARLQRMPKMPAFAPTVKAAVNSTKAARLAAILCASDSEDERVHIPKYRRGEDIGMQMHTHFILHFHRFYSSSLLHPLFCCRAQHRNESPAGRASEN